MAKRELSEMMSLEGRAALVTGGVGHIGRAIGRVLAEQGAAVALMDLHEESCQAAALEVGACGVGAMAIACDMADESALRKAAASALDGLGRLDILVNCAAFVGTSDLEGWAVPFEEQSAQSWRAALEVNLTAPFVLSQACSAALKSSNHGSIINIGSIYGMVGPDMRLYQGTSMGNPAAYAASKGGLLQLTRWLATVLAPRVRVNCISLGGVWRNQPQSFVERYTARTPLGRMAEENDVLGTVVYLASDMSAYVTGQNLALDGGFTAW
jgi:NAD(P)-dependent dehydrogenase (short-subunit alcohol dehydrogenase family)